MELIPSELLNVLTVALFYSVIQTALVEWIKQSKLFNSTFVLWLINCGLCAVLGTGFAMTFYGMDLIAGLWVSLLSAIGASGIYKGFIKTKTDLSGGGVEEKPLPPVVEVKNGTSLVVPKK